MKFSYTLIKRLVPEAAAKNRLVEDLTMRAYQTEELAGSIFDSEIPHNRYADSASHLGVAREYSAISGKKLAEPQMSPVFPNKPKGMIKIRVENKNDCPRYGACLFELGKKGKTPAWMAQILKDCGLRLIDPAVDVLNYVMLEIGQPMHAFDVEKFKGAVNVRRAREGERVITIDNQEFVLNKNDIVIADDKQAQAIAGIKGGKQAEISTKTKRILVESANFDQVSIYRTSRRLGLVTDASIRFGHGLSSALVELGLNRARVLLEEIVGAKFLDSLDVYPQKENLEIIGFDVDKFNNLTGLKLTSVQAWEYLRKLGFKKMVRQSQNKKDEFMVEVPLLRRDINAFEDVVEEVVRLVGIDGLVPQAPVVRITPASEQDTVVFKDQLRTILARLGFSEVYNYSFASKGTETAYELENPLAKDRTYLRQNLASHLEENLRSNSRFFKDIRIFEVGDIFDKKLGERFSLGVAIKSRNETAFFELKGAVEQLLNGLGLIDYTFIPEKDGVLVKIDGTGVGRTVTELHVCCSCLRI